MRKDMLLKLSVVISKQGRRFVAYSQALDLSTTGKSEKDARRKFEELVEIFFEEIMAAGTTHDILSELGWKKKEKSWSPPEVVSSGSMGIRVPVAA